MTIEILIFSHFFQRRLCWVLSSLLQQKPHGLGIRVSISGLDRENGMPSNHDVVGFFQDKGLEIHFEPWTSKEDIARPSLLKNYQIQNSKADWIMCHSADHVFSLDYFAALEKTIAMFPDDTRVLGSGNKTHTDAVATDDLMQRMFEADPLYVPGAFSESLLIKDIDYRVRKGAGGHFFFRREACMNQTDGFYVTPENCKDKHLFDQYMNTRSDPGFRSRMGGINKVSMPPMRHLNHRRDKEEGKHLEYQR